MALKAFLLSGSFVAALNASVLLCISLGFGLLLPATPLHVLVKLACGVTAAVTILFLTSPAMSKPLAVVAMACNATVLVGACFYMIELARGSEGVSPSLFAKIVLLLLLVVPAFSLAAVASSWPRAR